MKFTNRRDEAMAKFAVEQDKAANEAAFKSQLQRTKTMKTPVLHADHKLPSTRRDLVSAGLMSGLAYAAVPGILTFISKRAYGIDAAMCSAESGDGANENVAPGYLHIELSGGASLAGNMVFGKQAAGSPLELHAPEGYGTVGFGDGVRPSQVTLDETLGAPFHPESRLLMGMMSVMSPEAVAKSRAAGIAGTSGDDSRNNPLNPIQLVAKTRTPGALTTLAIQSDNQNSGGRTAALPIGDDPALPKALVSDEQSLANLVDPGLLATRLSKDAAIRISETAGKLSENKLKAFNAQDLSSQVQTLIACGYLGSKDLLSEYTAENLRPSTDAAISGTPYGNLTLNQVMQDENQQRAIVMSKLLTDGLAAGATIEMGGYDYHGQGRDTQDEKDFAVGVEVGLALETAHRKGVPLMVAITSDGSTAANDGAGRTAHRADSGARGSALMFAIGVDAAPEMINTQVGKFSDAGAVDTSYLVTGNSPNVLALAIAYNYASLSGNMAAFEAELSKDGANNPFNQQEYGTFAPLV